MIKRMIVSLKRPIYNAKRLGERGNPSSPQITFKGGLVND